ncbi:MAG TPA: hypothetical protein VJB87_03785 [Candidatus Nanoarchaeia archaeon]|nr:hypothetical protein [Candidatus Nanoarchaeia archaeon]
MTLTLAITYEQPERSGIILIADKKTERFDETTNTRRRTHEEKIFFDNTLAAAIEGQHILTIDEMQDCTPRQIIEQLIYHNQTFTIEPSSTYSLFLARRTPQTVSLESRTKMPNEKEHTTYLVDISNGRTIERATIYTHSFKGELATMTFNGGKSLERAVFLAALLNVHCRKTGNVSKEQTAIEITTRRIRPRTLRIKTNTKIRTLLRKKQYMQPLLEQMTSDGIIEVASL